MSSTSCEQRSSEENDGFVLYMFEEDLETIKSWAEEPSYSGKQPTGGFLIGLWTNTRNPVVHIATGKDEAATEDYPFLKSPQFKDKEACRMFSPIGYWSLKKCEDREQCFRDKKYVFLQVEVKHSCPISSSFHPFLLCKKKSARGKIEVLKGKNPFRLPEDPDTLTTKEESLKQENNEGFVAFMKEIWDSGVRKVKSMISDPAEQSYQDKQSKMPPSMKTFSQMPRKTSFPSQNETKDASTCTKKNQWYLTECGQKNLQEISNKLDELTSDKPKISRDSETHNIMILFSFENKSYVITFPPNFPRLNADLYCSMPTRSNPSTFKLQSTDPINLVQEVVNKLHK